MPQRNRNAWAGRAILSKEDEGNALIKTAQLPIGQTSEPSEAAQVATPALAGRSFIELIQSQWHRERPDLDLSNFLLSIYLMRLGESSSSRLTQCAASATGSADLTCAYFRAAPRWTTVCAASHRPLSRPAGDLRGITKKVDRLADPTSSNECRTR
jgi:hypothetical protein